ncbi:hypothetical protein GCM10027046_13520 [Uliginosibacterium flavum]|uniref:GDSL family lipase n=1 Tax=Uliginosibacterium flavum TaxID=1396831 RepID=A0ABV2TQ15_9RHOO
MRCRLIQTLLALSTSVLLLGCAATPPAAPDRTTPSLGSPKKDGGQFLSKHESFLRRDREGPIDLLFIGDSITEGWHSKAPSL